MIKTDKKIQEELFFALNHGATPKDIEKLINQGANIHKKKKGFSPLAVAALSENVAAVKFLLKKGATIGNKIVEEVIGDPMFKHPTPASKKIIKLLGLVAPWGY